MKGFTFSGINIYSTKPVEVFEFYKKLGFKVLEEGVVDSYYFGATFALQYDENSPMIWIWKSEKDEGIVNQFVFNTDNKLKETYLHFKSIGIDCEEPQMAVWGGYEMMLTDPAGNKLLFLD